MFRVMLIWLLLLKLVQGWLLFVFIVMMCLFSVFLMMCVQQVGWLFGVVWWFMLGGGLGNVRLVVVLVSVVLVRIGVVGCLQQFMSWQVVVYGIEVFLIFGLKCYIFLLLVVLSVIRWLWVVYRYRWLLIFSGVVFVFQCFFGRLLVWNCQVSCNVFMLVGVICCSGE